MTEAYAAGGLYSTVGDFYRWDQALLQRPFPPRPHAAQMMTPAVTLCARTCGGPPSRAGYGYGLYVGTFFNQPLVYHPGSTNGFMARNVLSPQA
jgi:CubicO group peptidase (beta-lactamase class C family)